MNRLENLTKGYIAPLLKKTGFKKKKLSWNRVRRGFIDVIEVQESKGSVPDGERFTLNIGVFVPEYFEFVWNEPYKGFVREADCVVRFRLGDLLQESFSRQALDIWWNLNVDEDIEKVGVELQLALQNQALPFLDSMCELTQLHEHINGMNGWQKKYPLTQIYFALLKDSLGEISASKDILNGLISGKNKAWASKAQQIMSRMGKNC